MTLFELNSLVRKYISQGFPGEHWIQAEISDVRTNASGHCYLEFIQKDSRNNTLIAKARGTIWGNVFRLLKPYFEQSTGQAFVSGIKVLVKVTVEFHELYGYSLTVSNIDPTYTLGDMALKRKEILRQLQDEGILGLNKELVMPILPKRIAVISSSTAAGYDDFKHQLQNNNRGYSFNTELFPAVMQGNQLEASILEAFDKIVKRKDDFDCVAIIRGGGSTSDLSGFDNYLLAAACTRFPLPVITGIGHERDDTVLDSVSHIRVKTPTAVAEYLISRMDEAALRLEELVTLLVKNTNIRLENERNRLVYFKTRIPNAVYARLSNAKLELLNIKNDISRASASFMIRKKHQLELIKQRVDDASPEKILRKGYSLTLKEGKMITDASQVQEGDVIETRLAQSCIKSIVK